MGAEIDRLDVQIETKATKVNNSLDTLVTKLDKVSSALSRLNSGELANLSNGVARFAQTSAQLSHVKTSDFTRLTKNIIKLSEINTKELYGASHAMKTLSNAMNTLGSVSENSYQVAEVAKDIAKLGGAKVQSAIANLPALAAGMNDLMSTLSNAPQVSDNIIKMTAALAGLASQGEKVGTASKSLIGPLNRSGNVMTANTKKVFNLSSAIGKLYQRYFLLMRGADKLWGSIESSMNYVETLNYFDAALGQVAELAVSQWEKAGYDSAEAYYASFSDRAKKLTSKMTGFNVNDDGTLTASREASLGINPTKLMNYQATFAQMSSSMGVSSETSLLLSQALTEIGADLASVKNMDFDKVWTDMASGLAGMSRTLDKYGVNIRNVNLQHKLLELGIEENITNLNQNDKALLRTIILLDSTKYAWGDLADTINYPANQIRLLDSNVSNLSRTVGNLFLPALSNTLPYVNGLVIATERLVTWVGSLMGIDLSEILPSEGSSEIDMSDLLGDTEDLTGSLDDASDAAKKLKSNLQGFDELNVITTTGDTNLDGVGSGLTDGLLDEAFIDAFSEYQKTWDEAFAGMENRANMFADRIEGYFQPIKDLIGDFATGDYFEAGQDTSKLVSGIFYFFADAIEKVDWDRVGNNIGEYLNGIEWMDVFSSGGNFVETAVDAAVEMWKGAFKAEPIATTIVTALSIAKFTGLDKTLEDKITNNIPTSINLRKAITITGITLKLSFDVGKSIAKSLVESGNKKFDLDLSQEWIDETFEEISLTKLFGKKRILQAIEHPFASADGFALFLFGKETNFDKEFSKFFFQGAGGWKNEISDWFEENVEPWFSKEKWVELGADAGISVSNKLMKFTQWWNDNIVSWWEDDVTPWFTKEKWTELGLNAKLALSNEWTEFTDWWETTGLYRWWTEDVEPFFDEEKWSFTGIKDGLSNAWDAAIETVKKHWNKFAGWFNDKFTLNIDTSTLIGKGVSELLGSSSITLASLPTYQGGGFPEDGLFYANHNELVGQFSNGKTAVANNQQITEGIAIAVHDGNYEQNELLREQNDLLRAILQKETGMSVNDIGRSARQYAHEYYKRTGKQAYQT